MPIIIMGISFLIVVALGLFMANNEPEDFPVWIVASVVISYSASAITFVVAFISVTS
jgi:ABC-type microcin C transport system permease subunit YejB